MQPQTRNMRIVSALRRKGGDVSKTPDWYEVELTDGKNHILLLDVATNAGPIHVGEVYQIDISPTL